MLTRSTQITESHCGPAVVQMLLSNLNIKASQRRIAVAAGVVKRIRKYGVRIDQIVKALDKLNVNAVLWYKKKSSIEDIIRLNELNYPVGIEWQGMFYEKEEEEEPGYDYGHYSIVTRVDRIKKELIMVDPYKDFAHQDRIMDIEKFKKRWRDENEIRDTKSGRKRIVRDDQLLFIITNKGDTKPKDLGLKRAR